MEGTSSASSATLPVVHNDLGTQPATILIVEDEAGILRLMAAILTPLGYKILTADDGEEALRLCQEHTIKVDLLITDVVMPGMSGHELAEAFKALQPEVKVLYMSGWPMRIGTYRAVEEGHIDFIAKPFNMEDLAAKVRSMLTKVD